MQFQDNSTLFKAIELERLVGSHLKAPQTTRIREGLSDSDFDRPRSNSPDLLEPAATYEIETVLNQWSENITDSKDAADASSVGGTGDYPGAGAGAGVGVRQEAGLPRSEPGVHFASPALGGKHRKKLKFPVARVPPAGSTIPNGRAEPRLAVSALSSELSNAAAESDKDDGSMGSKLVLTVYFPDGACLNVTVLDGFTVGRVVRTILETHRKHLDLPPRTSSSSSSSSSCSPSPNGDNLSPSRRSIERTLTSSEEQQQQQQALLLYDNPECYHLRLHEGDGEPDSDFPPLHVDKLMKHYGKVHHLILSHLILSYQITSFVF